MSSFSLPTKPDFALQGVWSLQFFILRQQSEDSSAAIQGSIFVSLQYQPYA